LPNIHFLWCRGRRSPHSLSQCFPTCKTCTLMFHHYGLHHPTEAPSYAMVRSTPFITLGPDYTILPLCHEHPSNWENNMLFNKAYQYQPWALHGKHGCTFHEQVLRITSKHYHNRKWYITSTHATPHHHQHPPAWIP
jgi:hypothetical protein